MSSQYRRRDFLKTGAGITASLGIAGAVLPAWASPAAKPLDTVRIGFVGAGGMGSNHVKNLLAIEGTELKAICDINPETVERIQQLVVKSGQRKPTGYSRSERDFERMCNEEDLDLVYTATPWEWHVPVCVAAMKAGKHAITEVPAAVTLEECWEMVETSEKTGKYCIMQENVNYMRPELMMLNLVRKGMLGELLHGEAGYMHDLRSIKMGDTGEGHWRYAHSAKRNGNLYPTHGLGPLAWCMDINHGDRFDYLVSASTNARGLNLYAKEHLSADNPKRKIDFINGDVNSSLIRTVNGKTIVLQHDCDTPRPYSRTNLIQGTKGIFRGYPEPVVHIEGRSPEHKWEDATEYYEKYDHPLWKHMEKLRAEETAAGNDVIGGVSHGGADFIEDYRLIQALRTGVAPDYDVYDAASWSAVSALSEKSVANRSRSMDFPDFTRGKWKTNPPVRIMGV
jgi:predicted dehydrogenase